MKPFLGIDLTTDKKNENSNGAEFLVAEPSPALAQSFDRSVESANKMFSQSLLPLPLRIVQWICGAVGAIVSVGILRGVVGDDGVSLSQGYKNAPWIFWLGGICLLIWGILKIISTIKLKTVLKTDEGTHIVTDLEGIRDAIFSELAVPPNAKEVDILFFFYKIKNGNMKVCEKALQSAPYLNPIFQIYTDAEHLYIANMEGKYAFPLSSLVSIHTVKKHIRIAGWNKDEAFNKGIYKQYKLTEDDGIHCKCYHILEINRDNESWGIYIPNYELPVFEELTGLKAQ